MEPESHRLDREALIADRLAAAERVRRETDEIVAAAAAKRRAHDEWQFQRIRSLATAEREQRRFVAGIDLSLSAGAADQRSRATVQPLVDRYRSPSDELADN